MNIRIKELAEQATKHYPATESSGEFSTFDKEKFALLIVRECANVIADDDLAKDCGTFMMDSYAKGMLYSAHLIKVHFGVGE